MRICGKKGTSLIEILVATFIFACASAALLSSLTGALYLINTAKDQTAAISDSRNIMERIRASSFADMALLFPDAASDGPANNRYQDIVGGYSLNNEHIAVTYPNINADPLEILVDITWQDKRGRAQETSISTFKTR